VSEQQKVRPLRTVAEHVVEQIKSWGIQHVFGVAGDTILPMLEAIRQDGEVRYIACRHEEAAAFMASACAKLTGRLAVCLAETGPASIHLLNGVYEAQLDRVPLLALTGEVESSLIGTHWPQAINQSLAYQGATVYNHTLHNPQQLPEVLHQAMRSALLTPGAARLGLPKDMQAATVSGVLYPPPPERPAVSVNRRAVEEAAELLENARRPLLFIGRGARGQRGSIVELAEKLGAPIVHTMPALGVVPREHPLNLGVSGKYGTTAAAEAMGEADVVLVVGSTWWQPEYVPDATYIQVDCARSQVGARFPAHLALIGDAAAILPALERAVDGRGREPAAGEWTRRVKEWKQREDTGRWSVGFAPRPVGVEDEQGIDPCRIISALDEVLHPEAILCLDVGANTFWVSNRLRAKNQDILVSGHWRSMGFGLPSAIAAKLLFPERQVVAVVGDGGFVMTMGEFTTAVANDLAITVLVLNNGCLAEEGHRQVRLGVEPFGVRLHNPDFAAYARNCGGNGRRVEDPVDLEHMADWLTGRETMLVDIKTAALMPNQPKGKGGLKPSRPALKQEDMAHV